MARIPTRLTDASADFVELFFDLVFVFAITQVTHMTAHHLDIGGVLRSLLVFWMIWWAWTMINFSLNIADTRRAEVRVGTLMMTGVAFVMAVSTAGAFGDGAMMFALSYNAVRVLGLGLYLRLAWQDKEQRNATLAGTAVTLVSLALVVAGAYADETARAWWWLGAIAIDLLASVVSTRAGSFRIFPAHLSERHGLIVIIALGESLIVAGAAVAGDELTTALLLAGGLAVVVTCLLWWSYFGWVREFLEEHLTKLQSHRRVVVVRDGFAFGHYPLICGVISTAVGFENILSHPADPLSAKVAIALGLGVALFAGSTAGTVLRVTGVVLWPRLLVVAVICGALALVVGQSPATGLGVVAVGLVLMVTVEHVRHRQLQSRAA